MPAKKKASGTEVKVKQTLKWGQVEAVKNVLNRVSYFLIPANAEVLTFPHEKGTWGSLNTEAKRKAFIAKLKKEVDAAYKILHAHLVEHYNSVSEEE